MGNKCINCKNCYRYKEYGVACVINSMSEQPMAYPTENKTECMYYFEKPNDVNASVDYDKISLENKTEIQYIDKNKDNLDKMENFESHVQDFPYIEVMNVNTGKKLTDEEYKDWKELTLAKFSYEKSIENLKRLYAHKCTKNDDDEKEFLEKLGVKYENIFANSSEHEERERMLNGITELSHFEQVTDWKRVMNAARRTIGKDFTEKEPSTSWKAKILLAEHSPIRLLEYDFGWRDVRQWVTAHLVRHHIGVEKFVHSQRADRRKLPCDRDHIYQGAKNDMDMTANAQAMINISRKRLCNCASKETREAWQQVIDELKKVDPIMANKCVPECVYRGFCPEFMSTCKYYKTPEYKKRLAEYRRTRYGKDVKYYLLEYSEKNIKYIISDIGKVFLVPSELMCLTTGPIAYDIIKEYQLIEALSSVELWNGKYVECIANPKYPISYLVYGCFSGDKSFQNTDILVHIDGNIYNNDIENIQKNRF